MHKELAHFAELLDDFTPRDWDNISAFLVAIRDRDKPRLLPPSNDYISLFGEGTAFITFSYGIDGVSIEISKYAATLNSIYSPSTTRLDLHFIGGDFQVQVDSILKSDWHRFRLDGIDGWNKWDDGEWFDALYQKEMRSNSRQSASIACEMYTQARRIAEVLAEYLVENHITFLVPVNVASNPGNFALTLALVLVSEFLGVYVLNSNHDFYWESGKPPADRLPGEEPGVRDHFFRNIENKSFFSLFEMIYPWNGSRWLQVNINARQSRKLVDRYGFPVDKVSEISTCISDTFFESYTRAEVLDIRIRMAHILSSGYEVMNPNPVGEHLAQLDSWMADQIPVILGSQPGLSIDPRSEELIVILQPTRIVGRKRIERNFELLKELLDKSALGKVFIDHTDLQLILQITGPTPEEHQEDLEKVLCSYRDIICTLPAELSDRIFIAFSVGQEAHESFDRKGYSPLTMPEIYRMADVVVFPSETEGRGLPIIESSASGVPIICSQYDPQEVFEDVVGTHLPDDLRIRYTLFPEGDFTDDFLCDVSDLILNPQRRMDVIEHNREAVRARYSHASLIKAFQRLLEQLISLDQENT